MRRWLPLFVLALHTLIATARPVSGQTCEKATADSLAERGWAAYRGGDVATAGTRFGAAIRHCTTHNGARVGMGYVALRNNDLESAERSFLAVLATDSANVDALVGAGLTAFRAGRGSEAAEKFERVLSLDPSQTTALDFLEQARRTLGVPPRRPPLQLPESTIVRFRTHRDHLEFLHDSRWEEFYVKGVNLGSALPGNSPSTFPDSSTYVDWIAKVGAMGANAIRVYTIHPPRFYQALGAYNAEHPASRLLLIQGAWASPPPDGQYDESGWLADFRSTLQSAVDVVHGRASLLPAGDEPYRHYTADVSRWTLAFIIGREWEPQTIAKYNTRHPGRSDWQGRFIHVFEGSAAEVWMGRAIDHMITYEMDSYHEQRPIAFVNWPTLDPLHHVSEPTNAEEVAIIRSLGGGGALDPDAHNDDEESLDASRLQPTTEFPAGQFAAFHVYPYYPDFLTVDPALQDGASPEGPSTYFAYLEALKARLPNTPILIAEYGVPSSLGISHIQPQGWHHGGHTETGMAAIASRLTREIAAAGMAGGVYFSLIDEWFKTNWLVGPFEIPENRRALWLNRMDPEQQFGIIAMESVPAIPGPTIEARRTSWQAVPPLYQTADGIRLRVSSDGAYLWIAFQADDGLPERLVIGFDTIDSLLGDHAWPIPGPQGPPVGLEFALVVGGGTAELLADSASNPWLVSSVRDYMPRGRSYRIPLAPPRPPGTFFGRWHAVPNTPFRSVANDDGIYTPLLVVVNRLRYGRDSTEYEAAGYNRGVLPEGPAPDGTWETSMERDLLEIRIPWMLLNVTDPSGRRILQGTDSVSGAYLTQRIPGIRIAAAWEKGGGWQAFPAKGDRVAMYRWSGWEQPQFRARLRPVYHALRETFQRISGSATHQP
jgi:tetratricopeptide (TPR) repeat protein